MEVLGIFDWIGDYIVPFIIILSVLVFVHELGHYLLARWNGVKIEAFAIGFGPEIFGKFDSTGTRWKFCLIPFGGYVKMFGDEDASSGKKSKKKLTRAEREVAFHHKALWQKAAIVFAGPLFNYIFAILSLVVLFMTYGQPFTAPVVSEVLKDSPAEAAGLITGDRIVAINGREIRRFEEVSRITRLSPEETLQITIIRNGENLILPVTTKAEEIQDITGEPARVGKIGVMSAQIEMVRHGFFSAVGHAFVESIDLIQNTYKAIKQMIAGTRSTDELGGPIRIAELSGDIAREGFSKALFFTALLSINLAIINLFPLPPLDGGHLLFYGIEAMMRRPIHEKVQNATVAVGVALVVMLMVFVTWNDLMRLDVLEYIHGLLS